MVYKKDTQKSYGKTRIQTCVSNTKHNKDTHKNSSIKPTYRLVFW